MNKNALGQLSEEDKIALRQQLHPYMQASLAHQLDAVTGTYKFRIGSEVKHLETGGIYIITGLPNENVVKAGDGWADAYAYLMVDGRTAYRAQEAMEDGRFEEVPAGSALEYAKQLAENKPTVVEKAVAADAKPTTIKVSLEQLEGALPSECSKIYTDYEKGYNKALRHARESLKALFPAV
jgi:hypothetical protein